MEKSVNDLALELNQKLKEKASFKEYAMYSKAIEKDAFLKKEEEALKTLQKQIVQATYRQDGDVEKLKAQYKQRLEAYNEHPLVVNYRLAKEVLNEDLQYIKDYINGGLK